MSVANAGEYAAKIWVLWEHSEISEKSYGCNYNTTRVSKNAITAPFGCKILSQDPNGAYITPHYDFQHPTLMVYSQHSVKVGVTTKPLGCYPVSNTQRVYP